MTERLPSVAEMHLGPEQTCEGLKIQCMATLVPCLSIRISPSSTISTCSSFSDRRMQSRLFQMDQPAILLIQFCGAAERDAVKHYFTVTVGPPALSSVDPTLRLGVATSPLADWPYVESVTLFCLFMLL